MDYVRLGRLAERLTRNALFVIQEERRRGSFGVRTKFDARSGRSSHATTVDDRVEAIYMTALGQATPDIPVLGEERAHTHGEALSAPRKAIWIVDPLDGTRNFIENTPFGYGTQCALLHNGTVPIAFVGDATTGEIFGYYGNSGVFRIDQGGRRTPVANVSRRKRLSDHVTVRRPGFELLHPLTQRLLRSGRVGEERELSAGIGATTLQLLTDEIGLLARRRYHEHPWDAIPTHALCEAAGMVLLRPNRHGTGYVEWQPNYRATTFWRGFDLLALHRSRLTQLTVAARKACNE